jgi:hypothetical protein
LAIIIACLSEACASACAEKLWDRHVSTVALLPVKARRRRWAASTTGSNAPLDTRVEDADTTDSDANGPGVGAALGIRVGRCMHTVMEGSVRASLFKQCLDWWTCLVARVGRVTLHSNRE